MSEFRIFCIGALLLGIVCGADGKMLGPATIRGSVDATAAWFFIMVVGGVCAVAAFGKWNRK